MSPLRRARLARNWTLEDAVAEINLASPGGEAGATPSLLSAWERGKIRTSLRYRKICCEIYDLSPEVLFTHQDGHQDGHQGAGPEPGQVVVTRVVHPYPALISAMIEVVHNARRQLVVIGSRTREAAYLDAIEHVLAERPGVVHHRVLFGPPSNRLLVDHLLRLLQLRDPAQRVGAKTLHLGIVDNTLSHPERFFVASESEAVMVIPSLTGADSFDTGILLGAEAAVGLLHHAREAYAGARRIETAAAVEALQAVADRRPTGEGGSG